MSETNTLHAALLAFQKKGIKINKDATNPHFKSKYASLTNIIEKITPALNELGLTVVHSLSGDKVITSISDGSGAIASEFPLFGSKAQDFGSSTTYGKRYNLGALLNLDIDDDDDGNTAQTNQKYTANKEVKPGKKTFDFPAYDRLSDAFHDGKIRDADHAIELAKTQYEVSPEFEEHIRKFIK